MQQALALCLVVAETMYPQLTRINLYPIKSLDPIGVSEAVVLHTGGLSHDREYCLRDQQNVIVNSKIAGEKLISIRSEFNLGLGDLVLRTDDGPHFFRMPQEKHELEKWFSEYLGQPISLSRNVLGGFPDDNKASGPTLVSTATIEETASWFDGITTEEIRRRFRCNLEIDGVPAFWEDHLFESPGGNISFRFGDTTLEGVKPCVRCAVPQRDSFSGEIKDSSFVKIFTQRREETLPAWADRECFDHFYCLSTNSVIPQSEAGRVLQVGDAVVL